MTFDAAVDRLTQVLATMENAALARVRVEEPEFAVEIRRAPLAVRPAEAAAAAPAASAETQSPDPALVVRSDVVGHVRFVRPLPTIGAIVEDGRELAFVESLGTRTAVRALGGGRIDAILVEDGQAVDYGMALFALVADGA